MGFWINSFKTPIFNHSIIVSDIKYLIVSLDRWRGPIKTVFEVIPKWEYGIVVYTRIPETRTYTVKYAKNIKGNRFIDNDVLVGVPGVGYGIPIPDEAISSNTFVMLGYFDQDNNFYAVEICDLGDRDGKRSYIKCCTMLLWKLKSVGFSTPTVPRIIRKAKVIKDVIPECSQGDKSILIIPSTAYDQAILYKPNNKASHES